tara:strand:+ start:13134 stop:14357 length:1224 start_codon:yes stop_codon:yes gene_type:complete
MRKALLIVCFVLLPLMTVGCVSMALPRVPAQLSAEAATPSLDTVGLAEWEAGRAGLQQTFLDEIYGTMPAPVPTRIVSHELIDAAAFAGVARIEQYTLDMAGYETHLALVLPANATGPVPMIVMQNFCGNSIALDGRPDIAGPVPGSHAPDCTGMMGEGLVPVIFGEYINEPPVMQILSHGFGLAMIYAGDIVPDSAEAAPARLAELVPGQDSGAIAAWAWVYSRVVDVLDSDERFDAERTAIWGHSRNAKSAVLAAAFDPRIDLVIAHQAGTAGTALAHSGVGEPIDVITEDYPHWFAPAFASYGDRREALPVDMHELIALIAPRPVIIGGAWRDQWSDPQSSFRAAEGATPIYRLYGSQGLTQSGLTDYDPTADLAVAMRPGLHGVHAEDWDNFLAFLDAHFATN